MDVSNSTGGSTGYRVMGSGAAPCPPAEEAGGKKGKPGPASIAAPKVLHKGTLAANTYVRLEVSDFYDICTVEFLRKGKEPIRLEIKESGYEGLLVTLVPNGGGDPKPIVCRRKA